MIRTSGLDGELTSEHEIMVRALAVIMPGNDIAIGQRKDTNLNVRADNDGLDAFHLVVGHLMPFALIKETVMAFQQLQGPPSTHSRELYQQFSNFGLRDLLLNINSAATAQ